MAKNLSKLLLHASLACCIALGVFASGASLKSGFESTLHGELSYTPSKNTDDDSPELWLQAAFQFIPVILLIALVIASSIDLVPSPLSHLKPIRAPPAIR